MWRSNGMKLTGFYGNWHGEEFELSSPDSESGMLNLVQEGGMSPGSEWIEIHRPNLFAKPGIRFSRDVPAVEVSDISGVEVFGLIDGVKVCLLAEGEDGKLAIESDTNAPSYLRDQLARKYGLEYYDDRRSFAFGWVPAEDVQEITTERREIEP